MRIGVMCSGEGTNFENIVHSCPKHDVVLMVYNKKKAKAAKRAERLDIPSCYCKNCLLYTSPSPRDRTRSRMPSSA